MELLNEMFKNFKKTACRIEALPQYKIIGDEWERYQAFTKGEYREKYNSSSWPKMLKDYKKMGKVVERIRVVPNQLTSYLIFEFNCYVQSIIAGEQINVVDKSEYDKLVNSKTRGDYWIFDNKDVLYMEYDEEGAFIGSRLIEDNEIKNECIKFYKILMQKTYEPKDVLQKIRNATVKIK